LNLVQTIDAARVRPERPIAENIYAVAPQAMASTSHPVATEIALQVMRDGGTAADAFIAAAFAQVVLEQDMTSIAGTFVITYWDAERGVVGSGGGTLGAPAALVDDGSQDITTDGRSVLIPGFVHGAWNTHQRWGKLPWARLLDPAIALSREGFEIDWSLWGHVFQYKQWVERTEQGREIWAPGGHLLMVGDQLRQPDLARTLEGLRDNGPDYFYKGPWARKFVEFVQANNGVITLEDMAAPNVAAFMAPDWQPGTTTGLNAGQYHGYEVPPASGLLNLALNLVEAGDLRSRGPATESADTLYLLMRIAQEARHTACKYSPDTHNHLTSKAYAREIWPTLEHGPPLEPIGFRFGTCGVTIADPDGNIATGTHSISSSPFGMGYYVDGVLLNRSLNLARLGRSIAGYNTSSFLMKDGKPAYAMASPSRSFFENLLQTTVNAVEFGMGLGEAVMQPRFGGTDETLGIARVETSFPRAVIDGVARRGMRQVGVAPWDSQCGSLHAIERLADGSWSGCADPRRRGQAKGF